MWSIACLSYWSSLASDGRALMLLCIQHLVSKVYGFLDLMRSVLSEDYDKPFYSLSISDDNDNDEGVLIFL